MKKYFLACLLFIIAGQVQATNYTVSTATAFNALSPIGDDTIFLQNILWSGQQLKAQSWSGSSGHPITIICEDGQDSVKLTSGSSISLNNCNWIVVQRLYFYGGAQTKQSVILLNNCNHSKVYNCKIDNYNSSTISPLSFWVCFDGGGTYDSLIHCTFINKIDTGSVIELKIYSGVAHHYQITKNYFNRRAPNNSNGGETIRIGEGYATSGVAAYTIIDSNYFSRCDGEEEIISVKSSYNYVLNNTFSDCQGFISFRNCTYSEARRNFFYAASDSAYGGVSFRDSFNIAVNNYFENLTGTNKNGAIVIYDGACNSQNYPAGKRGRIDSNTFYGNQQNLVLGFRFSDGTNGLGLPPANFTFTGNIFQGGVTLDTTITAPLGFTYASNYGNLTPVSFSTGYTLINPQLGLLNGAYRISASTPASVKTLDTSNNLIYSQTSTVIPVTVADVGTNW